MMQGVQATQEALEKGIADARQKLDEVLKELMEVFNKLKEKSVEGNKDALTVVSGRLNELMETCEKQLQELLERLKDSYEKNVSEEHRQKVEKTLKNVRETVEKTLGDVRTTYDVTKQEGVKRVDEVSKKADELVKNLTAWGTRCSADLTSTIGRLQKDHLDSTSSDPMGQLTESCNKLANPSLSLSNRFIAFLFIIVQAFLILIRAAFVKKEASAEKAAQGAKKRE